MFQKTGLLNKLLFIVCIIGHDALHAQTSRGQLFIKGLDSVCKQLKIPGLAVAVQQDDSLLVAQGFGYADLEKKIIATDQTVFRVASVTKTFTSTLVMQLAEAGKISLDDPIAKYGVDLGNPSITIRNLITHTSESEPGTHFQYNGYRFGRLGPVIEKATGIPFYELLMEKILRPLHMTSSAPAISLDEYYQYIGRHKDARAYFDSTFSKLARPYELNSAGQVTPSVYLNEFGAFGGLATNVHDLLKYSTAIDRHQFIDDSAQQQAFAANHLKNGSVTPYGLGWFVQKYKGMDYYWHYGQTQGESALFVKVPALKLTLAVMCNTDKLSQPFPLGDGDLMMSPVAQLFYSNFINSQVDKDFQDRQLIVGATMALISGDTITAQQKYADYARNNFHGGGIVPAGKVIARIEQAGVNVHPQVRFTLAKPTRVRVYGTGENCSADLSSWCDYGWIANESGKIIWQMQGQKAQFAGGAIKNRRVDTVITLPAGRYILKYKSDAGHAYGSWDSLPPDDFFWGIVIFNAG